MEKLGLSVPFITVFFCLATAAGCAAQSSSGGDGGGGVVSSNTSSSTTSSSNSSTSASSASASGSGGAGGGMGGAGGAGGGMGGAGGGMGGAGGGGGGFVQPVGSPDYPSETEQNNLKTSANKLAAGTKGFTGAIYPPGDVDIYEVDVAVNASTLKVAVTDGMGGCPPGVATYVRIFNDSNLLIASDTDAGPGLCSLLTPQSTPSLSNMPMGKYFVQVESASAVEIPFYIVDINLKAPGCGDGIVQLGAGEQCDDSNTVNGDGCSSICHLEGNYTLEVESNDTPAKASSLDSYDGVIGSINPIGDPDYFSFDITVPGSQVTLEVSDGLGGCPSGFDSKIYLLDAGANSIAEDDDGGPGSCSLISPAGYPVAGNLGMGKYYVKVEEYGNNAAQAFYVLSIKIKSPGCGDGILQPGEQCDDGNKNNGDGCSSTCVLEGGNYISETEPNNTIATANPLGAADGFVGGINPLADADYFSFDVSVPGSSVIIETGDGLGGCPANFASKISLYDSTATLITSDDTSGVGNCSLISPVFDPKATGLPMGTYTVRVEHANNNVIVPVYVVAIRVASPGCGDGVVVAGEQCDDANTKSGDGCSSTCQVEAPFEIEPNNSMATATPLWPGTSLWKASINPPGDHDYFTFTTAAVGALTLETHDADSSGTCSFDTTMYLLDSNGNQLVKDDDSGVASCSLINKTLYPAVGALPAGTYYVWIQKYLDSSPGIPLYQLDFKLQ